LDSTSAQVNYSRSLNAVFQYAKSLKIESYKSADDIKRALETEYCGDESDTHRPNLWARVRPNKTRKSSMATLRRVAIGDLAIHTSEGNTSSGMHIHSSTLKPASATQNHPTPLMRLCR
jgi:hypothetical protein